MIKPTKTTAKNILNRRASYDYALGDELVCGLELDGRRVRAARDGLVQLRGAFVTLHNDELWLNGASFTLKLGIKGGSAKTVDSSPVKLLATRRQITKLAKEKQTGLQLVPIKLLTGGRYIKLVVSLGRSKKRYDKRAAIKRREQEREIRRVAP
jgi:SsrA-binding protein